MDVGEKTIAICQCGLSRNKPFCDGSHHKTAGEEPGKLYLYDEQRARMTVVDIFPTPKGKFAAGK
ncbi:MAG: CDGSH iron-sulfur domain-containing protein [Thermoplasmata archaeon]